MMEALDTWKIQFLNSLLERNKLGYILSTKIEETSLWQLRTMVSSTDVPTCSWKSEWALMSSE